MKFSGPAYIPALDADRLQNQHERIRDLMLDGAWRTIDEIAGILGELNTRSVDSQIRHLRKSKFGGYIVNRRNRAGIRGLSEYQVLPQRISFQQEFALAPISQPVSYPTLPNGELSGSGLLFSTRDVTRLCGPR